MSGNDFFKKLSADLASVTGAKFAVSSYIRSSGSHSTGNAVDLVLYRQPLSEYPKVFENLKRLSSKLFVALAWPENVHFHIDYNRKGLGLEIWKNRKGTYININDIYYHNGMYLIHYNTKYYRL